MLGVGFGGNEVYHLLVSKWTNQEHSFLFGNNSLEGQYDLKD